jgi:hypothetical protein
MARSIPHASRFLEHSGPLAPLLAEIARADALLRAVHRCLPPPLDSHCLHATLHEGTLTLVTESPAWASRLRFFAPEISHALGGDYGRISACRVRVRPQVVAAEHREGAPTLSQATVDHLLQAAAGAQDGAIAQALRRLALAGAAAAERADQDVAKGRM